ncbi:MAG: hypothetical protein IJK99_03135 [Bacteroidales bacterium]|nr:hypothetical protein [Bacteroidales bacterium]
MKPMRSVRLCLTFSLILLFIAIANTLMINNKLPQKDYKITLSEKTTMDFLFGTDTTHLTLKKNDSVKFLGYCKPKHYIPHRFLVETYDGQRGYISVCNLGIPFVKEKTGDTIFVKEDDVKKHKYIYDTKDKKDNEIGYKDVYPVLSDTLPYLVIEKHGAYYMSPKKFEQLFIGKSIDEIDKHYQPAMQVYRDKDGAKVSFYNHWVLNKKKGYFSYPVVTYNDSMIATGYELVSSKNSNSKLFVKILPFFAPIIDCHFLSSLIQESFYGLQVPGMTLSRADNPNALMWTVAIITIILGLIWMFALCALPALVLGYLFRFRRLFYHLGDGVLVIMIVVVAFVSWYVWSILMLSWGMIWFFIPVILIVQIWAAGFPVTPLNTKPHDRCPQCRSLYTISLGHTDLVKEYDQWENRSRTEQRYVSGERKWKTWTETKWSDGTTTKSNQKNHKEETTTTVSGHYRSLVHYREYENHYICCRCGYDEILPSKFDDIIQETKTGESTESSTRQVY